MRMQNPTIRQFLRPNHVTGICLFTLSVLLAACGGGGGGGGGGTPATGATAAAVGTVQKIGSVKVNGVTFDCKNATVTSDDDITNTGDDRCVVANGKGELEENMRVVVTGKINDDGVTGSADSVIVKHRFSGPVANIDTTAQTFTVLGQTIQVDDGTVFKSASGAKTTGAAGLASLTDGETVRINGIPGDGGTFLATYVKSKFIAGDSSEVKGIVTSTAPDPVKIGSLILILTLDQTRPNVGDCVEAEGTLVGNTLTLKSGAKGLKLDDDCDGESLPDGVTKAEVEGVINGFIDASTPFKVGGQTVSISPSTTFRPAGASAADLSNGVKVEAEGSVTGGVLLASKIKIKQNGVRIEATADSAPVSGSFGILGITVVTNGSTKFGSGISLGDIAAGTALRVEGFKSGNTRVTATKIKTRSGGNGDVKLRGPLDADPIAPSFAILGVPVTTSNTTQFEDSSSASFFADAKQSTIVTVKGVETPGDAIAAEEVELEN